MGRDTLFTLGLKVTEITRTIFIVHGNNRGRSPFSNAILVLDKHSMLMDTGCGLEILKPLIDRLRIDLVVLSHSHPDHTGGTWLLQDAAHSDIIVPGQGAESIGNADKLAERFVSEDLARLWKDAYLPATGFGDFSHTSEYGAASEFSTGENRFIALHTPGHLQDHYCMWEPDKKILIGFDIDMSPFGPWYGNPESDIGCFKDSVAKVKDLPIEIYISSHARPMKSPHLFKRLASYESFFDERDRLILDAMPEDGWIDIGEIVRKSLIYRIDYSLHPDRILMFGETQMVRKHLMHLAGSGLIDSDGQDRFRKLP